MTPNSNYASSLMFGIQWDLVCKFLEIKGVLAEAYKLGNYRDAKIENIESGKYSILDTNTDKLGEWTKIISVFTKSDSGDNSSILLATGILENTNKMNLYDFAGNVWKWTLEMTSGTSNPCASRGGDYFDSGSNCPASKCYGSKTNGNYYSFGFRPTFYVN